MAKKRKRSHTKKISRLASIRNDGGGNSPRPCTPVSDSPPRSETPVMGVACAAGNSTPQDMLPGPPPLSDFGSDNKPIVTRGKRKKRGNANGLSPPRSRRASSRPPYKPKKPRSAYQFFVKERWHDRLAEVNDDGQPQNKDKKRMQKQTKLFAQLWKVCFLICICLERW